MTQRVARGFTLFETILVIGMLAMAAAVLMRMQPRIFSAQTALRDEAVGIEIQRACAERLLAVRRQITYTAVQGSSGTSPTCNGLGSSIPGFAPNPTVTLVDDTGATVASCTNTTCTATIAVTKDSGPAVTLPNLVLRLTLY